MLNPFHCLLQLESDGLAHNANRSVLGAVNCRIQNEPPPLRKIRPNEWVSWGMTTVETDLSH